MKLSTTYDPNNFETTIYEMWEKAGAFKPKGEGEPYSIVMPPPNANGNLHVGHALSFQLEDMLVRYYRQQGRDTLYIPGADHAGFETWVVFERQLAKEGKSRFDYTREELYSQVWDFVEKNRGINTVQLKALGISADWDSLCYTLDKKVINNVYATFQKMWQEGLVYRGERIINYCTEHQTGFADIEVEYKDEEGSLWYINYPIKEKEGKYIQIATTRPETMLGDTAIAINPEDRRFKDLVGLHAVVPIVNREIPIIADKYVEKGFGTGAVKITPAHDPNDFEIGQRHCLENITVIGFDGKITNTLDEYNGLSVKEARKKIIDQLQKDGLLVRTEKINHAVGHCYKCGTVIEPLLKEQWFVKMKPLVNKALSHIEDDEIKFFPESAKRNVLNYLKNLKDWNVSRQIAWGIPIPAFQNKEDPKDWIFDTRVTEPEIEIDGKTYIREEDTFDTWFSSSQWPYITTDYLENGKNAKFYPNSVLETGSDILYGWVSRMILMGVYRTGMVPFKEVYLHGMVLDEKGLKMSKSKGNVINPMEMLAKYGSDALRIGISMSRSAAQNQAFATGNVLAGRNFCNKLWNISRYILSQLGEDYKKIDAIVADTTADNWIVSRLDQTKKDLKQLFKDYRFSEAVELVYHFVWDDLADWYIEASKAEKNSHVLAYVLEESLKLSHPIAPFATETIWQALPWIEDGNLLINQVQKETIKYGIIEAGSFDQLKTFITEVRSLKAKLKVTNKKLEVNFLNDSLIKDNKNLIKIMCNLSDVVESDNPEGIRIPSISRQAWLKVSSDTLKAYRKDLEDKINETTKSITMLEKRLGNKNYLEKAPESLVNETKNNLAESKQLFKKLSEELEQATSNQLEDKNQ